MRFLPVLLVVSGLLLPTAAAGGGLLWVVCDVEASVCEAVEPELVWCVVELIVAEEPPMCENRHVLVALDGETYYLTWPQMHLYREENGCIGLQESATTCDDGREVGPDNALTLGEITGL